MAQLALAHNPLVGFLCALDAVEELAVESWKVAHDLKLHRSGNSAIKRRDKIYPVPDAEFVPVHSFDPVPRSRRPLKIWRRGKLTSAICRVVRGATAVQWPIRAAVRLACLGATSTRRRHPGTILCLFERAGFSAVMNLLLTRVRAEPAPPHFTNSLVDFFAHPSSFGTIAKFAVTRKASKT